MNCSQCSIPIYEKVAYCPTCGVPQRAPIIGSSLVNSHMKSIVASIILTASGFVLLEGPNRISAQNIKPKLAGQRSRSYAIKPFNKDVDALPPGYIGHDAKRIYQIYEKRSTPKGEFETTADYGQRMHKAMTLPIFTNLTVDDLLAFQLAEDVLEYNSDNQRLIVGFGIDAAYKGAEQDPSWRRAMMRAEGPMSKEVYTATNGFGAKVKVTKTVIKTFELAISNWQHWHKDEMTSAAESQMPSSIDRLDEIAVRASYKDLVLRSLQLNPGEASKLKPNIRLLAICKLKPPIITDGGIVKNPTFQNPTEIYQLMSNIHVKLFEVWGYDQVTGKILFKIQKTQYEASK